MNRSTLLLISSSVGLILSFLSTYIYSPVKHVATDCTKFGNGLDDNGRMFQDFNSFYPYYVCEHSNPRTKLYHAIGTFNSIVFLVSMVYNLRFKLSTLLLAIVQGYTFAWYSHFFIEKNRPATWTYPIYSFLGD